MVDLLGIVKNIGDWISQIVPKVISWFSQLGSGKLLTLIIFGLVLYFSLKLANKLLKIALIIASIFLIVSVGASWVIGLVK
jgi:hypothetical protein